MGLLSPLYPQRHGDMQQALSLYQIFTQGRNALYNTGPHRSKTLCTVHQYRYILFYKVNRLHPHKLYFLSMKSSQPIFVHYLTLPDGYNPDKDVPDEEI